MKTTTKRKVIVIPCSGMGKALGSVSRDATYEVVENMRKGVTDTICLALLVSGDKDSLKLVRNNKCVTIDGCPLQCAEKNVRLARGDLVASFRVIDILAHNRNLKPKKITFLDHDGTTLSTEIAKQVVNKVDELLKK